MKKTKSMGDFVADDGPDPAEISASGLLKGIKGCLENRRRESDVIARGFVTGVHAIARHASKFC